MQVEERSRPSTRGPDRLLAPSSGRRVPLSRKVAALLALTLAANACAPRQAGVVPPHQMAAAAEAPLAAPNNAPVTVTQDTPSSNSEPMTTPNTRPSHPVTVPGTGVFVAPPARSSGPVNVSPDGDIGFNFVNADVREVVREILGNQLHLNYVIDNKVNATITAQTSSPVPRDAVLPTLENVLRANGLALLDVDGLYRVLPLEDAAKAGATTASAKNLAGYGVRVMPLHFVSANELKSVLDPFVPPGAVLQADAARNLLIVTGSAGDLTGFADLVRQFDVDWLSGTSFGLYPLRVGMAKDVATELDAIFGESGSGPIAGLVRIVPIDRLNALLVISQQRSYLAQVKSWIDRLDYGDDQTTPRLFEYHVQNSRAADLAAVLTQLLSSGSVSTVQAEITPGSKAAAQASSQQNNSNSSSTGGLPGAGLSSMSQQSNMPSQPGGLSITTSSNNNGATTGATASAGGDQSQGLQRVAAGGADLKKALQPGLGGGGSGNDLVLPPVRIVADEKNNALVIFARPRDYRMIEDAIKRLDVVPLQVLIEATIAEVTLNDDLQFGLQYFLKAGSSGFELNNTQASAGTIADIATTAPGFNYIFGAGSGTKVILNALAQITHINVVSAPEVLVLDHQTAALQVGDQVPILSQQQQSTIVGDASIVNSVQYVNTGVILQVTPRVNSSGLITLDIDQSVSNASTPATNATIQSPTITQRRIVTSTVVQDGESVALGGLIQTTQTNNNGGIPGLKDIPVIGSLFSNVTHDNDRTELLVILTPRIVRNGGEARAMTNDLLNQMRAVKPLVVKDQK